MKSESKSKIENWRQAPLPLSEGGEGMSAKPLAAPLLMPVQCNPTFSDVTLCHLDLDLDLVAFDLNSYLDLDLVALDQD